MMIEFEKWTNSFSRNDLYIASAILAGCGAYYAYSCFSKYQDHGKHKKKLKKVHILGLQNVGNSCFLNSLVQCLAASKEVCTWLEDVNNKYPDIDLSHQLLKVITRVNCSDADSLEEFVDPSPILHALRRHGWVIRSSEEQDCHELFHIIVSSVEEEMMDSIKKSNEEIKLNIDDRVDQFSLDKDKLDGNVIVNDDLHVEAVKEAQCFSDKAVTYGNLAQDGQKLEKVHGVGNEMVNDDDQYDRDITGSAVLYSSLDKSCSDDQPIRDMQEEAYVDACEMENDDVRYNGVIDDSLTSQCSSDIAEQLEPQTHHNEAQTHHQPKEFDLRHSSAVESVAPAQCISDQCYVNKKGENKDLNMLKRVSLLQSPFKGAVVSQRTCLQCGFKTPFRYDAFESLSLPLPPQGMFYTAMGFNIQDLIKSYFEPESVAGAECEGCKGKPFTNLIGHQSIKRQYIAKLPRCLCLHIQRNFWTDFGTLAKRTDFIGFPEIIDLGDYTLTKEMGKKASSQSLHLMRNFYRLVSVVVHSGDAFSGHFFTYRIDTNNNAKPRWYLTSDTTVKKALTSDLHSTSAYILFYERLAS
ncbi:ubiquitin carboxyl-terminal hydrolase 30 homolog [Artemia franciscana]|uniref:Ubiquitin carboxyl-terminal hydrolase n=1 Tax=Artemia franciscana TaxID=6661 RepID=A0AA88L5S5_ARTSF|nr:hypothetical protein QYM36_014576 [Artemia franciscana]